MAGLAACLWSATRRAIGRAVSGVRSLMSAKQEQQPDADQALRDACRVLGPKWLSHLWRCAATLSVHDVFGPTIPPLSSFPVLNHLKTRYFVQLVLLSKAQDDSRNVLTTDELRRVLDHSRDLQYDAKQMRRLAEAEGEDKTGLEMQRIFAQMGNQQFPEQEPHLIRSVGRLVAMLETLPHDREEDIPPESREVIRLTREGLADLLGSSILDLSHVLILIYGRYLHVHRTYVAALLSSVLPVNLPEDARLRAGAITLALVEIADDFGEHLIFTSRAVGEDKRTSQQVVDRFLEMFSRPTEILRALLNEEVYAEGHIGSRLLPLDRYPIVQMTDGEASEARFIVPNLRIFAKSFAYVIDYTLLEHLGDPYSQARGALQELYLRALVEDRLPDQLVIPERTYGKQHRKGPDLTFIDTAGVLICIESKGRRMLARTRRTMDPELIDENLREAYEALEKLPAKIDDLYAGLDEYTDVLLSDN